MDEIEKLKKENESLKKELLLYTKDPSKRGYFSLVRIVNQQIDILNGFDLKYEITSNPKEDKVYDRTKATWEGLKAMILDLKALRTELKISDSDNDDETSFIDTIAQQRK